MNFPRKALAVAAASAACAIFVAWLAWTPDRPAAQLVQRWAAPPSQFITVDGLQVHLRDEGPRDDPVPIVLLHGTSASLHTWDGWAAALRDQRRVIRFDLPGFALTGPNAQHDYSIEMYVRFVTALLDQLGVQRCVLAGNSLGGQIAWSLASEQPARVDRLILVDASGYAPESGTTPQRLPLGFHFASRPVLKTVAQYTLPRVVMEMSVKSAYGDPSRVTPQLIDLYMDMTLRAGNRRALVRRIEQGYTGDPARIRKVAAPTLLLWGSRDRIVPTEFAERFARDIRGSQLVVLDGLGHTPQEEDPARTVAQVRRFLARP